MGAACWYFNPEWFGLYRPVEVYTTAPVTTEDYRKLFFSHIPDLENIWLDADPFEPSSQFSGDIPAAV